MSRMRLEEEEGKKDMKKKKKKLQLAKHSPPK